MRPLLLGMARSDGGSGPALLPSTAGGNSAADRLLVLSGFTRKVFLETFRRKNICHGPWDAKRAATNKLKLRGRVLVLGREVWKALGLRHTNYFETVTRGGADYTLLPHPSGQNRLLNDIRFRRRMKHIITGVRYDRQVTQR
jgi:hypothetical protein